MSGKLLPQVAHTSFPYWTHSPVNLGPAFKPVTAGYQSVTDSLPVLFACFYPPPPRCCQSASVVSPSPLVMWRRHPCFCRAQNDVKWAAGSKGESVRAPCPSSLCKSGEVTSSSCARPLSVLGCFPCFIFPGSPANTVVLIRFQGCRRRLPFPVPFSLLLLAPIQVSHGGGFGR